MAAPLQSEEIKKKGELEEEGREGAETTARL